MNEFLLPDSIRRHVLDMKCEKNDIGCSQAGIYKFYSNDKVLYLKIEPKSGELQKEYESILWLQGKLPVPQIIEWVPEVEDDYLLISEIGGKMLCDEYYLKNPDLLVSLLAKGIQQLQAIDIKACPIQNGVSRKLEDAAKNVKLHRVDMDDWESSNNGFSSPEDLLAFLNDNVPENEELVFTHGDYCLPNILAHNENISGFIDLGRAGIADQWQDIALCIRSLWHNLKTKDYDEKLLRQIGIPVNKEKLDYYILLDELF